MFSLPASAVGQAGSACAGVTFTLTTIDSNQGKLALNPSATVVLGPPGGASATCRIGFTIGVTRLPAKDSDPGAGLQTAELGAVSGVASATGASGSAFGTTETTVSKGTPGITTQVASATAKPGDSITDLASLTASPGSPAPTGTVTFNAYGPSDPTCAAAPVFTSTNAINGASAQSSPFTLPSVGTYRLIATYNGDGADNAGSGGCNDANEAVVVKAQPSIATHVAAPSVAVGATISDTATMTPQPGQPAPTKSVTFRICGPGDTACATPLSTVTASLSGATATSAPPVFTATTAGVYRFAAKYEGDASNSPVSGACTDANEQVTVDSDELPTVAYTPSTYTPHAGQTVTFHGSTSDPDGTITSYVWKWGDGTPDGSGATATHAFATPGLRSVGLYVTDSAGRTNAAGHGITVTGAG